MGKKMEAFKNGAKEVGSVALTAGGYILGFATTYVVTYAVVLGGLLLVNRVYGLDGKEQNSENNVVDVAQHDQPVNQEV